MSTFFIESVFNLPACGNGYIREVMGVVTCATPTRAWRWIFTYVIVYYICQNHRIWFADTCAGLRPSLANSSRYRVLAYSQESLLFGA